MKSKEIAKQYGLDHGQLKAYLSANLTAYYPHITEGFAGNLNIDEKYLNISQVVADYKAWENSISADKIARQRAEQEKKAAMANMLITSGFSFDGYKITKYSGYISGDDAISVDREYTFFGADRSAAEKLTNAFVTIRRNALNELKEAAYALGCNAVIGVDFDYVTLETENERFASSKNKLGPYVFAVTANGNAVIIEKE